jgi:uncharacterized paraquat-inducible protein A
MEKPKLEPMVSNFSMDSVLVKITAIDLPTFEMTVTGDDSPDSVFNALLEFGKTFNKGIHFAIDYANMALPVANSQILAWLVTKKIMEKARNSGTGTSPELA